MDDPFFNDGSQASGKKRKPTGKPGKPPKSAPKGKKSFRDEEIDEDLIDLDQDDKKRNNVESDEEEIETVAEKRLKMAKEMIARAEEHERELQEDEDISTEAISHRLKRDILEQKGSLRRELAAPMAAAVSTVNDRAFRAHRQPVTCVAVSAESAFVVTGGKDGSVIKWDFATGKKLVEFPGIRNKPTPDTPLTGHWGHVLCIALSSDDKFVVSGGKDRLVFVWDLSTHTLVRTFRGHKDSISGLAFRRHSHQLFSASFDRTIKIWNLDEMAYVETLYGHEEPITAIACLDRERAVSSGGRDHSLRLWKVAEESQLVFQAVKGNIDCVALITETNFVSGSDDGSLCLWDVNKKKPSATVRDAHGPGVWIVSVGALPYADVVASGASDGLLRVWRTDSHYRSLAPLFTLPVAGFINSIAFPNSADTIVVASSQEHRFGRWQRIGDAKSSVHIFKFSDLVSDN